MGMRERDKSNAGVSIRDSGTILLVDDDQMVRDLLKACLHNAGHEVTVASSGPEALSVIRTSCDSIRLLVTDLDMPEMSGIELAQRARDSCSCPVMLISGKITPPPAGSCVWDRFLAKPFTPSVFVEAVEQMLGQSAERPAPGSTIPPSRQI